MYVFFLVILHGLWVHGLWVQQGMNPVSLTAFVGVPSPFGSLFFVKVWLLLALQSDGGGKKSFSGFPSTCSLFSGCITCICRDGSPGRGGVLAPILKLMRAFFPLLPYLTHILIKLKTSLLQFYLVFVFSTSISQFRMY